MIMIFFEHYDQNVNHLLSFVFINRKYLHYKKSVIVSPVRSTYGGYYGLVVVTPPRPPPRPQTLHRSHDNLKNPYQIASIFYM